MKPIKFFAMFLLGAVFISAALIANAQDAASRDALSIVTSSRNRIQKETLSTRSRMVITARNGSTTERLIDQYSKDGPDGARTMIVFQQPASVAGTRFLTMDNAAGGTDQDIFLPSLGRRRRILANEGSGSFMGTDFSYNDIASADRDVSLDTHTLLREETLNGNICYVIESIPKDSSYQYSKMIMWIDRNNFVLYKVEMYDRSSGELVKVMEMSDFRNIQGRITAMQTTISTVRAGTSTTLFMEILRYDDPVPEAVFTIRYLETGRAQ